MTKRMQKFKVVVICGPTGVGKTRFAIELAKRFSGRIIGADSMQIYRYMDIGTAKPTPDERAEVTHHLVDCVDPAEEFSAADFAARADDIARQLSDQGILPLVVGGTGLYIKALIYGLFEAPPFDAAVRERLRLEAGDLGAPALHERLARLDPEAAGRIHPNDAFRIVRALEVLEITGLPISAHQSQHGFQQPRYDALTIGLSLPREQLYARINQRVDMMLAAGLKDEVQTLLNKGFDPNLKSMQSLGYRHMIAYLNGTIAWEEAVRTLKRDHRHYAKRQMTWFSANDSLRWLEPGAVEPAAEWIRQFLSD